MVKKRSTGSGSFIILIILIITAVGLWTLLQQTNETKTTGGTGHKYQVQKTGAGVMIDFTNAGRVLDTAIIKMVKDSGFKYLIAERRLCQAPRQPIEGIIQWENRHLTLAVPTDAKLAGLTENLTNTVKKFGGRVLASYQDTLEGRQAIRFDVGFEDTLDGEPVTIVTHNIWLVMQTDTPVSPPQGEVKTPVAGAYSNSAKAENLRESKVPSGKQGRLALVIDDFGLTMEGVADLLALNQPLTFAVLPHHTYSAAIARQAAAGGKQVILHLPLESISGERAEVGTISTAMTDEQISERLDEAIAELPQISGVNNHQGSKATADPRVMKTVLAVLRDRGLFFVDSRTSSGSVAYRTASAMGLRAVENDHFIDNSSDVATIKRELATAGRLAISQGEAVAIGHNRPHTVIAIREMLSELENMGVKLVFVADLAR